MCKSGGLAIALFAFAHNHGRVTTSINDSLTKPRLRGVSHLFAAIGAVPAMIMLVAHARGGAWSLAAAAYGGSVVLLLGASALYHTPTWSDKARARLRSVDHSMIYVLIAGSYTPFCLAMGGTAVVYLLPVVWLAALGGVLKSIFWAHAPKLVSTLLYIAMGWALVPYMPELWMELGPTGFMLLAIGGALYTLGAVCYATRWPDPLPLTFGYHEIFHVMVIVALSCHYAAIWAAVG